MQTHFQSQNSGSKKYTEHEARAKNINEATSRLDALRTLIKAQGYSGYILPRSDEFQGEYVPAHAMRLAWLTGFTGSAGFVFITLDKATLFVDGRYTLQVTQQTESTLYDYDVLDYQQLATAINQQLSATDKLGFDPSLWTRKQLQAIQQQTASEITWQPTEKVLIDEIWSDAPAKPSGKPYSLSLKYAGVNFTNKIQQTLYLLPKAVELYFVSKPEDLCWLLNVRGNDVACTPFVLSTLLIHRNGSISWFIKPERVDDDLKQRLGDNIQIYHPSALESVIKNTISSTDINNAGLTLATDFSQTSEQHLRLFESLITTIDYANPISDLKSIKNITEQAGSRAAHQRDGIAMVKFLHWLETSALQEGAHELDLDQKLLNLRGESDLFRDVSFDSITGSGPHGAIVHYRVTEESNRKLQSNEIVLVDSGGQYPDGTTDITRTVILGTATTEQKKRFTQVLKGHIQLALAKFPAGITGAHLDILARAALWKDGEDFDHGTGHGVGSFLSVHEGPQSISRRSNVPLKAGMIVSNEPGFYKNDEYGIRIENLVLIINAETNGSRDMMAFETLTLAPIQQDLIDKSMLTIDEITWLNRYHQTVYDTLYSQLPADTQLWLKAATLAL